MKGRGRVRRKREEEEGGGRDGGERELGLSS